MRESTCGPISSFAGLYPRKAAKSTETGGRWPTRRAVAAGTPWLRSPAASACGSVADSPTIIRVKKIPIESTCAEFWKVWFIPPPAPRCAAGRLFITPARLGEANAPIARPISSSTAAKTP
jgi:hypothetical protein